MSVIQNIKCPSCQALANPSWFECAVCQSPLYKPDWMKAWRALAASTSGIESKDDPRYEPVMRWIDVATTAEVLGDWRSFSEAAEQVREIMRARA